MTQKAKILRQILLPQYLVGSFYIFLSLILLVFGLSYLKLPSNIQIISVLIFIIGSFIYAKKYIFRAEKILGLIQKNNPDLSYGLEILKTEKGTWLTEKYLESLKSKNNKLNWFYGYKVLIPVLMLMSGIVFLKTFDPSHKVNNLFSTEKTLLNDSKSELQIRLTINSPTYTLIKAKTTRELNVSTVEGSILNWEILNPDENLIYYLEDRKGDLIQFIKKKNQVYYTDKVLNSGIYRIVSKKNNAFFQKTSYYTLQVIKDLKPTLKPTPKELFTLINELNPQEISCLILDDYGVKDVKLNFTVAKGQGEGIKFTQKTISLSTTLFKEKNIKYIINLNDFNLKPGDELFYRWDVADNKWPNPNFASSETFFIKYLDPKSDEIDQNQTLGINLIPEYFKSQRQIVIDTEKLIKVRKKASKKVFEEKSNDLGFDQKSLRIRYGQYLGEEYETNIGHATDNADEDILAGFVHDHDHEEHSADAETHAHAEEHSEQENSEDPLAELMEQYVHNHDDEDLNTFYEKSTKSLLKSSLDQMWQSELQLRLYEPEKALPYAKKALELLKEAQQKSRNYVQKASVESPPIDEKTIRYSGKKDDLLALYKFDSKTTENKFLAYSVLVLGCLEKTNLSKSDLEAVNNLSSFNQVPINVQKALKLLSSGELDIKNRNELRIYFGKLVQNKNQIKLTPLSNQDRIMIKSFKAKINI